MQTLIGRYEMVTELKSVPVAGTDSHSRPIRRSANLIKRIVFGLAALNLLVLAGGGIALFESREHAVQLASVSAGNLAHTLEYSISGLVDAIDLALQSTADEIERTPPSSGHFADLLRQQQKRLPDLISLRIYDASGATVYRTGDPAPPQASAGDRSIFNRHQANPGSGLLISPTQLEPRNGQTALLFSRPLAAADGAFAGAVMATLRLKDLNELLLAVDIGRHGEVVLMDRNLATISRYPEPAVGNPAGQSVSAEFSRALESDSAAGRYRSSSDRGDGIARQHVYLEFERYPLLVDVGLAEDEFLRVWHKQLWIFLAIAGLFLVASCSYALTLIRSLRRQHADAEKLRGLFELSPLGIALNDLNGRFVEFNDAFCRICGYSAEELANLDYWTLTPSKYREQEAEQLKQMQRTGYYGPYEKEYLCKNGKLKPLRLNGMLITGSDGQRYIWSIVEDITQLRQNEEEMKIAATVYQASSEGMMVLDNGNRIISVNPAFTAITGYSAAEVVGHNPRILNSDLHNDHFFQALWQTVADTGAWQGEVWNRRKSGEIFLQWLSINTVFATDGAVQRRVAMFSDITEKKKSDDLIWRQANYDSLTELPNRQMVRERLETEIKQCKAERKQLALLFIDLDRFKEVNDTLGHDVGDSLLVEAARRMSACVRDSDTVSRLGGDEFMVVLSGLDDSECVPRIAGHLLEALAAPYRLNDELAYISASIGITIYPTDATDFSVLLRNADQAMYAAKRQGRNCYHYYTTAMQDAANSRARLSNDLHQALAEKQFEVYYQPIVELATNSVHKAEALIRWQHPTLGQISPAKFIPIAEDTGLIVEIGDWVFRQAAAQAVRWRNLLDPEFQISVNKSPVQFRADHGNHLSWFGHLRELGLAGSSIAIEITEGLLVEASDKIRGQLLAFRDQGTQVALDDFGTGYSSLAYLKKFDIDYLKIDQAFVRNLANDSSDMALCEAMIVMAHKLGIKVIAEGVETAEQCALLKQIGCDYGQGYLFARPMPAEACEAALLQARSGPA
ncbi:bifunctional diguanylate cyclase/phosphodiesterase [Methylomonas koyamae]|uniref:bifunctional diguanylate cyclase/phosphodiesterase n=1 Tax=Methylomonas koyamae TaxID=702114 RepID=UPI002873363A|nr:EAL domain-containing protein [Methylomonas koyamae]WNB77949.1 EAL domain-containing protein [Methylomonas koyamae]